MFPLYHVVSMKHLYVSCFFASFRWRSPSLTAGEVIEVLEFPKKVGRWGSNNWGYFTAVWYPKLP